MGEQDADHQILDPLDVSRRRFSADPQCAKADEDTRSLMSLDFGLSQITDKKSSWTQTVTQADLLHSPCARVWRLLRDALPLRLRRSTGSCCCSPV